MLIDSYPICKKHPLSGTSRVCGYTCTPLIKFWWNSLPKTFPLIKFNIYMFELMLPYIFGFLSKIVGIHNLIWMSAYSHCSSLMLNLLKSKRNVIYKLQCQPIRIRYSTPLKWLIIKQSNQFFPRSRWAGHEKCRVWICTILCMRYLYLVVTSYDVVWIWLINTLELNIRTLFAGDFREKGSVCTWLQSMIIDKWVWVLDEW